MPRVAVLVLALGVVLLGAGPAAAHEEINPKTFPTGQPTFFTLSAANEESADLVKVVLHAPNGLSFGATTREPAGWSVQRTDDTITWTGGAVKPDHFDNWGYEIEGADQPATLAYKIDLTFADKKTDNVEVDVTAASPVTPTTTAGSPTTSTSSAAPASKKSSSGSGKATAALVLAAAALVVAAAALAGSRRPRPAGSAGGETSAPGAPGGADW